MIIQIIGLPTIKELINAMLIANQGVVPVVVDFIFSTGRK